MLGLVAFGQVQILSRRLLRFLDESVKQNHSPSPVDVEKNTGNSTPTHARSHFIDTFAQRSANGHANGPAKLDSLDVLSDALPVRWRKPLKPFPYRLPA